VTSATVVVATVNGERRLERLLPALSVQTVEHETIVVDNGSADRIGDRVREAFPAVDVLRLEENAGFARAVNAAAARASGDVLVLLNDDCVCDEPFVESLTGALDPGRGVVMAASVLVGAPDPSRIESAGMELDRTLLVWEHLHGEPLSVLDAPVPDPIGPSAAGAAFDRDAFLSVGGFDERLFAYWEDVDLVLRLRLEGGRCALARRARATHEHSATLGWGSPEKNWLMGFGRAYLLRKWSVLGLARLPAVAAREAVICTGQIVLDGNAAGVRGRLAGWRAAARAERRAYPRATLEGFAAAGQGTVETLRRRLRRRGELRRRARHD